MPFAPSLLQQLHARDQRWSSWRFIDTKEVERLQPKCLGKLVPKGGLEPPRVTSHAPQTCASTSSATSAQLSRSCYRSIVDRILYSDHLNNTTSTYLGWLRVKRFQPAIRNLLVLPLPLVSAPESAKVETLRQLTATQNANPLHRVTKASRRSA